MGIYFPVKCQVAPLHPSWIDSVDASMETLDVGLNVEEQSESTPHSTNVLEATAICLDEKSNRALRVQVIRYREAVAWLEKEVGAWLIME